MRLNRGTLAIMAVCALVIIGVIFNQTQRANQPLNPTPTASAETALFAGLVQENVVRYEVRDNATGATTTLNKDVANIWSIQQQPGDTPDYPVDQLMSVGTMGVLATLTSFDQFESADLASFGLDTPGHTLTLLTNDGTVYTLHIGDVNPNGTRYYGIVDVQTGTGALQATAEATALTLDDQNDADVLSEQATSEATATPEPVVGNTGASATEEATASSLSEANDADVVTEEADATAETSATEDAVVSAATEAATAETTPDAAVTLEVTAEATIEPLVVLEGTQTIVLVPSDLVVNLLRLVEEPPFIYPTATPTVPPTANPFSEVQQTATAAVEMTATMDAFNEIMTAMAVTPEPTAETAATAEPGEEPTAEPTAE